MTVSPEPATTFENLPPELSIEVDSGTRGHGQKMCVERHQSDYIVGTCRHIVQLVGRRTTEAGIQMLRTARQVQTIRRLTRPDDMLETFSELSIREPDLMRPVLQASVASLVNVRAFESVDAELKRRAVKGN